MMLLVIAAVLLAGFAQWYLLTHGLDGVSLHQQPAQTLVEPDQPFTVRTTLENRKKYLPVLLQVQECLPEELEIIGQEEKGRVSLYRVRYYHYCQYLRRRAKVIRSYQATLPARGRYFFRGAVLHGNDFFGTDESTRQTEGGAEVVVKPTRCNAPALETLLGGFLGDVSVRRYIMEDPTLHIGFRDYTGREPMRAISWSQSAKGKGLLVKQYDHTTDPSLLILLSIEGGTPAQIEACYSLVRSLCELLEQKHIRYDFLTNAIMVGASRACQHTGEGLGAQHLNTVLEGLGRATYTCGAPLGKTLRRTADTLGTGACVLVLPTPDATQSAAAQRVFAGRGGSLRVLTPQEVLP